MKWKGMIVVLFLLLLAVYPAYAAPGHVKVAVTINVIEDMVKQVGGDKVEVTSLVTGLENPHTYSSTPNDRQAVENSNVFMEIGMGLEPWAGQLTKDIPNERIMVLSDNCTKLGSNPHVWMDPENGKAMAWDIAHKLCELDPENEDYYMQNLHSFLSEINYAEARAVTLGRDVNGTGVITSAPGFSYLLHRMNISELQTLVSMPGSSPTVGDIAKCEDDVRDGEAYALIDLEQSPSQAVHQISQDTGAVVVEGTPLLGVLGIEHYTDLISYNAQAIHDGILQGERDRDMNLLENRVDALSMQVTLIAVVMLFLIILALVEIVQIRKLRRGNF